MTLKTQTTLRINKGIYNQVAIEARKLGISVNAYISIVLARELVNQIKIRKE